MASKHYNKIVPLYTAVEEFGFLEVTSMDSISIPCASSNEIHSLRLYFESLKLLHTSS